MAKKHSVVHSQMPSGHRPSLTGAAGVYDHNPAAPFTKPHSLGGGGIPVKFTDTTLKVKVPKKPSYFPK
jgi:hypothetical protein